MKTVKDIEKLIYHFFQGLSRPKKRRLIQLKNILSTSFRVHLKLKNAA